MLIQPYLHFNGTCEQAVEFYRAVLGAEISILMRYKDSPVPHSPDMVPADFENKIMHVTFRIGESTIMASDSPCKEPRGFEGFSLSITTPSEPEADRIFTSLSERGEIQMPL